MVKVLIYGGTGALGSLISEACVKEGHTTYVVIRASTRGSKAGLCSKLEAAGVRLVEGDFTDKASIVHLLQTRKPDVVISCVAGDKLLKQQRLLVDMLAEHSPQARFLPSEFSVDYDSGPSGCPDVYTSKIELQAYLVQSGVPYTLVTCSGFAEDWASALGQMGPRWEPPGPEDEVIIFGTGHVKGLMTTCEDTAAFTAKTLDDPRTLNKRLHIRVPSNYLSQREMIAIWERLSGHRVKTYEMSEKETDESADGKIPIRAPRKSDSWASVVFRQLERSMWVYGDYTKPLGSAVDALTLYPDVPTTSIEEYLRKFVKH